MKRHQPPAKNLKPSRLRLLDQARVGGSGLRARPVRVVLSALGIAIGIAAMTAVVGISESSRADLDQRLAALGTNMLTVRPGQSLNGSTAHLPTEAPTMIKRIPPVLAVASTGHIADARVYRHDRIPRAESGGIAVLAAQPSLLATVGAQLASGGFLNDATIHFPAVVLGTTAAKRLAISQPNAGQLVLVGGQWTSIIGILQPVALAPELDAAAIIGWPFATEHLAFDGYPTTIYTRVEDHSVQAVRGVLGRTVNPERPTEVDVSRPSDALAAREAADETLQALLLGLGAVALIVGGIGVANTMVISVLERRGEIGLRRALGATRGNIRAQFLSESLMLSALGGGTGVALGVGVTTAYAATQHWRTHIPPWVSASAIAATLIIGAIAGLYPATRAARLNPTEALTA